MAPKTKIHLYLEIEESHYTAGVARFSMAANYRLFSLMANVRNDGGIEPVAQPKGLPKTKLSGGAQAYLDELGAAGVTLHTPTWLNTDEMIEVRKQADGYSPAIVAITAAMEALVKKGSNPRLIVAFED
jgi:hypothetical protein